MSLFHFRIKLVLWDVVCWYEDSSAQETMAGSICMVDLNKSITWRGVLEVFAGMGTDS